MRGGIDSLELIRLSEVAAEERARLLDRYERDIYAEAFPDAELREDPAVWRRLLEADPYPPPPQPLIEVLLLYDRERGAILGGATVELYRTARSSLLTYIAVDREARGRGIGRRLIHGAHRALARMGGSAALLFAETERLQDAHDPAERTATETRQRQLDGLGARLLDFDYVMPPLSPGLPPKRLHLMLFLKPADCVLTVPAATVRALVEELAAALGADLLAHAETRRMVEWLEGAGTIPVRPLPVVAARHG